MTIHPVPVMLVVTEAQPSAWQRFLAWLRSLFGG